MEKKVFVGKGEYMPSKMLVKYDPSGKNPKKCGLMSQVNTGLTQFRLGLVEMPPGLEIGQHIHNCDEILYTLEGKGIFTVNGVEYECGPEDMVYVGPNEVHGPQKNTGDTTWRYLFIMGQPMNPLGEDDVCFPSGEYVIPRDRPYTPPGK